MVESKKPPKHIFGFDIQSWICCMFDTIQTYKELITLRTSLLW